jgi:hypothetical protein
VVQLRVAEIHNVRTDVPFLRLLVALGTFLKKPTNEQQRGTLPPHPQKVITLHAITTTYWLL